MGIGVVYQQPVVFPDISVVENIFAGHQLIIDRKWWPFVNRKAMKKQVEDIFIRMGITIDPSAKMASLSIGDRQLVEIAKALTDNIRVLILDEPTASLSENGVEALFEVIKKLTAHGVAILFISHRIDEIFKIGDRVTILRDGQKVATRYISQISRSLLIEMMVGRPLNSFFTKGESKLRAEALRIENWGRRGDFANISFSVKGGEILGLAGLVGSGRTEVARTIMGIDQPDAGKLWINGDRVIPKSPGQMLRHGVAYIPEDRQGLGLTLDWSSRMNITLPVLPRLSYWGKFPKTEKERVLAREYTSKLQIHPPDIETLVSSLSGGNQQKVLLAKWLTINPNVLILDDPTVGVDIGAKEEIYRIITSLVEKGVAVIFISSDLPELLAPEY